jgi:uncharacterized protein (TIGR02145 family)
MFKWNRLMFLFAAVTVAVGAVLCCGCSGDGIAGAFAKPIYGDPLTYGGQKYKTVEIGYQTWMARNLNYQTTSGSSRCYYDKPDSCAKYGRLYTWDAAKTACPSGWHLPSQSEWGWLLETVGGSDVAGKWLKARSGWGKDGNGIDPYGFSALPRGTGDSYGEWWTADVNTYFGETIAHTVQMTTSDRVENNWFFGSSGEYSVRCVKN